MQSIEFRAAVTANPFRPFRVHLGSGQTLDVHHRDFVLVSPSGRTAFIYTKVKDGEDDMTMVDIMLIEAVELIRTNGTNGAGKRKRT